MTVLDFTKTDAPRRAAHMRVWPGRPVARTYTGTRRSRQVGELRILGDSDRRQRALAGVASCYRRAWRVASGAA